MGRRKDGENDVAKKRRYVNRLVRAGADELKCGDCAFRARSGEQGGLLWHTCEFLLLTGQRRGCDPAHCTRFRPMTPEIEQYINLVQRRVVRCGMSAYPLAGLENGELPEAMRAMVQGHSEEEKQAIARARARAYWEANKEKIKARRAAYWEANKEKIKARQAAYWEANKERMKANQKAWREKHREEINARARARRAEEKAKK